MIQSVAIIGAGRLGRGLARLCADHDFQVVLEDVMPANLRRAQEDFGQEVGGRISYALTVEDAVCQADIAIDFVPDELESKLEIFSLLDRMAPPKTILCTPSHALSITDLASCTYRPDRCLAFRTAGEELISSPSGRLLYPPSVHVETRQLVLQFWQRLGIQLMLEPDCEAPMLVKNLSRT